MSFLGSLNCVDVLPFLFYSFYLWDSRIIFLLLIFFCEINFLEFLKEALIWFDWFSNLTELTLLSFAVATCFLTYLALLSPTITWTPLFLLLCYLCHAKFGFNFQKLLPGGPALEASLGGSISSLLRDRMSPLLQTSLLQALALTDIWSMPKLPHSVSSGCDYLAGFSLLMLCPWLHCLLLLPLHRQPLHPYTNTPVHVHLLMYFLFCVAPCLHYILSLSYSPCSRRSKLLCYWLPYKEANLAKK